MERRMFLRGSALGGVALALSGCAAGERRSTRHRFHSEDLDGEGKAVKRWYRYKFIGQPVMDNQIIYGLGLASHGLTDIGEVLDTATRIHAGNEQSWFDEWCATGRRLEDEARYSEKNGHTRSAGDQYLRAGAYYRLGLIRYSKHEDPRMVEVTRRSLACHDIALRYHGYDSHEVKIPYGTDFLPGRVHFSPGIGRAPVIVINQGFHSWPEDTHWVVQGALLRGYHVLTFHGPGQGAALRLHGLPFLPQWEKPVGAVLDFAEKEPRLDMNRVALIGISFGGALAPRAAAYDPRIYALIVDPGTLSWGDSLMVHFENIPGLMNKHRRNPAGFDRTIRAIAKIRPDAAWYFADATWKHGVDTPHELIDELRKYDNKDSIDRIRCKTLVMDGAGEDVNAGEAKRFYDALRAPKFWMNFGHASAAQTHCQGGGLRVAENRLYNWVEDELK